MDVARCGRLASGRGRQSTDRLQDPGKHRGHERNSALGLQSRGWRELESAQQGKRLRPDGRTTHPAFATHRNCTAPTYLPKSDGSLRTLQKSVRNEVDVCFDKRLAVDRLSIRKHKSPDGHVKHRTHKYGGRAGRCTFSELSRCHALLDARSEGCKRRCDELGMTAIDHFGKTMPRGRTSAGTLVFRSLAVFS